MTQAEVLAIKRGPYKVQALKILRDRGVPVGTILDIGVCHGTPELMTVWPDRKHLLFEPVAEFSEKIKASYRNIEHELIEVAVAKDSGEVGLKVFGVLEGMDISHSGMVESNEEVHGQIVRTVRKVSLDEFLEQTPSPEPYLLKIDVDGKEMDVIQGAARTLRKCSIVIVEVQAKALVPRIQAIQQAGFELFDLAEPCYYDSKFWQCDAIFVRSDIASTAFRALSGKVERSLYQKFV